MVEVEPVRFEEEEEARRVGLRWKEWLWIIAMAALGTLLLLPFPPEFAELRLFDLWTVNTKLLIGAGMLVLYLQKAIVKFDEYERGVVFRLGRFNRVAGPGWELIFPIFEKHVRVDMRLHVYTIPPQEVVTRDKVRFLISPEVFVYVSNPKDAVINVRNYKEATLRFVNSTLTHICGNSDSDYIVSRMDEITNRIGERFKEVSNQPGREWGVVVPDIRVTYIKFPEKVQDAMHEKVAAEQLRMAAHEKAEATRIQIEAIREAGAKLTDPALAYMYLDALEKVAKGRATKIVLPLEITRIAEAIGKKTGRAVEEIPKELVDYYRDVLHNFEERIKKIEEKLEAGAMLTPEDLKAYEKEIVSEEKEYKQKIEEIKKRLGIE